VEPAKVELAAVEPKPAPAKAEPPKVLPAKAEPAKAVVAEAAPKKSEPTPPSAPAKAEPAKSEPAKLARVEPKAADQAAPLVAPPVQAEPRRLAGWKPEAAPFAGRPAGSAQGAKIVLAQAETPPVVQGRETLPDPKGASDFDPGQRVMTYVGFRQKSGSSEVFVRCDGKAKYRVEKMGDKVVLELIDTRVNVKNNERPLDTSYFKSAVTKVQAVPSGGSTRIEVDLRESVPYEVKRIGSTISIEFKLPASA
jgi:hypothetical protein